MTGVICSKIKTRLDTGRPHSGKKSTAETWPLSEMAGIPELQVTKFKTSSKETEAIRIKDDVPG